jgi:putative membrane protein insertion efficiency factor
MPAARQTRSRAARLVVAVLSGYKRWVSPWLPPACRFEPTCSVYMAEAIRVHGVAGGIWLGLRRLARCHPWNPGGYDPVPPVRGGR